MPRWTSTRTIPSKSEQESHHQRSSPPVVRPRPIFWSSHPSDSSRCSSYAVEHVEGGEWGQSEDVWDPPCLILVLRGK
jgi:hypothetical protein